jgi:formylglycine-generating enzyme required for sulfatase activity
MVVVPAGVFLMGSTYEQVVAFHQAWQKLSAADYGSQQIFANELYQLMVYLDYFEIDQLEITNRQYQLCVDAAHCERQRRSDEAFASSYNTPAVNVTQKQAQAYCEWVGKRLPTEAEWEKAARGTDGRIYPWGNQWDEDRLNVGGDLMAVGSFPEGASLYGALDMVGNAAEWTADFYTFYPGMRPTKVIRKGIPLYRGGRLSESSEGARLQLRVSSRSNGRGQSPEASRAIGFRCVRGKMPPPLSEAVVQRFPPDSLPTKESVDFSEMVPVPAGEFVMGTDEPLRHYASARPAHRVC